ncbi:helix-turn-helix domain-containing protein [Methylobacterium sp. J-088]|uniref:helix-turn-helix domain-containing protein n=1 Tax=Methylobacterium sp. J-088 TaxID=2836664 RepID=UPI001FBA81C9|nr:helix-turn-helix domain-containing protein [Methylobacterium sp. J-088]MCJ2065824.1 helix-turn-helix domain-containing protein [Methylobacterium sp. J-088]
MRSLSATPVSFPPPLSVRLLSVSEACALLGIKRTRFYELLKGHQLSAVKLGCRTFVRSDELERFIEALETIQIPAAKDVAP